MKVEVARREIESLDYYLQNHTDDYGEDSHTAMMMAASALSENKGEWVACKRELLYFCSECRYYSQNNLFNFCPNCGADMRGKAE